MKKKLMLGCVLAGVAMAGVSLSATGQRPVEDARPGVPVVIELKPEQHDPNQQPIRRLPADRNSRGTGSGDVTPSAPTARQAPNPEAREGAAGGTEAGPRLPDEVLQVAAINNRFSAALYGQFRTESGNLFFSPYSVSSAVSMAWAGARGQTAAQFAAAMQLTPEQEKADTDWVFPAFGKLTTHINDMQKGDNPPFVISVANAVWGQEDMNFLRPFLDVLDQQYRAPLQTLNFAADPESARQKINRWVEVETRDRIKNLLPEGSIDAMTRMVLTNAIYFKGKWENEFSERATRPAPFSVATAEQPDLDPVQAPLMFREGRYRYVEAQGLQMIELPYIGGDLVMTVFLPRAGQFEAFEQRLKPEHLGGLLGRIHTARMQEVQVFLPRFKMTVTPNLKIALQQLGLRDAFSPQTADFSGMTGSRDLHIGAAVHKAFVEVNEEGTEAAAATGLVMRTTSVAMDPTVFRADRPFVFAIRDRVSGSVLFMGRVVDPTK